jgi:hypothetical protein
VAFGACLKSFGAMGMSNAAAIHPRVSPDRATLDTMVHFPFSQRRLLLSPPFKRLTFNAQRLTFNRRERNARVLPLFPVKR